MNFIRSYILLNALLSLLMSLPSYADDAVNDQALRQTQTLLKDKKARESALNTKDAKAADQNVKDLTGNNPVLTDEIYGLAAEVFEIIVKESGGDPDKMSELLSSYQKDPASFANKFSASQKAKLRDISSQVPQPVKNH